jgi:hypothetical protein
MHSKHQLKKDTSNTSRCVSCTSKENVSTSSCIAGIRLRASFKRVAKRNIPVHQELSYSHPIHSSSLYCVGINLTADFLQKYVQIICCKFMLKTSEGYENVVGITNGYGLGDGGVLVDSRIFSSPCRPDRIWGPPNLLFSGSGGSFPGGEAARE